MTDGAIKELSKINTTLSDNDLENISAGASQKPINKVVATMLTAISLGSSASAIQPNQVHSCYSSLLKNLQNTKAVNKTKKLIYISSFYNITAKSILCIRY